MRTPLIGLLAAAFVLSSVPMAHAAAFGNFGTFVSSVGDADFVPLLTTPATPAFCIGYLDNTPVDAAKRAWFFHIADDGACTGEQTTATKSFRLTSFGGAASRAWLAATDTTYLNKPLLGLREIPTDLCFVESDGIAGWSPGDPVFLDADGDGVLSLSDLRLVGVSSSTNAPFSVTAGIVKAADADLALASRTTDDPTVQPTSTACAALATWSVQVLDLGTKGAFDSLDNFYLMDAAGQVDFVFQGAARLASATGTSGTMVLAADPEARDFLTYVPSTGADTGDCTTCAARVVTVNAATTRETPVYLHFEEGSTATHVLRGDLTIRRSATVAAGASGSLVTSTALGAGSVIENAPGSRDAVEDLVYFLDLDNDATYDRGTEPVYLQHPDNALGGGDCPTLAAGERCIQVNDIRLTAYAGKTAGSLVQSGDSDYSVNHATRKGHTGFFLKAFQPDLDTRTPLAKVTTGKYVDADADSLWDPATEEVYLAAGTALAATDTLVWSNGAEVNPPTIGCAPNPCSTTLKAGNLYTTGPDATWSATLDEQLVWSANAFLTVGDYRLQALGGLPAGLVGAADPGVGNPVLQAGKTLLYASFDPGCPAACFPFLSVGDVQLYSSFGSVLSTSSPGVVPKTTLVTPRLVKVDFGTQNNLAQDAYYFDFGTTFSPSQVLRMTTLDTSVGAGPAGRFLTTANTVETSGTKVVSATTGDAALRFREGTNSGFGTDATVYIDLPADLLGTAPGTVTQWDSRVTPFTLAGSFAAGTRVIGSNADASGAPAFTAGAFQVLWWDADQDGTADSQDFFWAHRGAGSPAAPSYLDVRLGGDAGLAGGSVGGGGGGGTVTDPGTTTSSTSTTSSTTSSTSTTTSDTTSATHTTSVSGTTGTTTGASSTTAGSSSSTTGGAIPAPGLLVALAAVGAALALARRRLP